MFDVWIQDLRWTHKPSMQHLFPKLRLQFKPNLVQLKGGMSGLPITDKNARATSLNPPEWKEMLRGAQEVGRPLIILSMYMLISISGLWYPCNFFSNSD